MTKRSEIRTGRQPNYIRAYPNQPESLDARGVFSASNARILRVTSVLPSLASHLPNYPNQRWTNAEVEIACIDKSPEMMRTRWILDLEWSNVRRSIEIKEDA